MPLYEVTVELAVLKRILNESEIDSLFSEADHSVSRLEADSESGDYQGHSVGYDIRAPNKGEAYRRVINLVRAKLAMRGYLEPAVELAEVTNYSTMESEEYH